MGLRRRRHRLIGLTLVLAAAGVGRALGRVVRLEVHGTSMVPTLWPGDRVVALRGLPVRPGDLVAVADPRDRTRLLVKRVARVGGGRLHVVGDDPSASTDSRVFGDVDGASIAGRVVYRYWPRARAGTPGRAAGTVR